jgi:prepilin peptidase CpaA
MTCLAPALQGALGLLVITAGGFDLKCRRVPNWLVLTGLVLGFGLNGSLHGTAGLVLALKGMGLGLLVYLPLYALRAMGAGDAKLMAAVGSMAGPANWLAIFTITSVLGGVAALVLLAWKRRLGRAFRNLWLILSSAAHRLPPFRVSPELDVRAGVGLRMPHAAVITAGTLIFLWISAV